jgi:hypothetical protein
VAAARKTEWMITSIQTGMMRGSVHALEGKEDSEEKEVNALKGKKTQKKGSENGGRTGPKGPCYECNEMGHIKRFCPNRKPQGAFSKPQGHFGFSRSNNSGKGTPQGNYRGNRLRSMNFRPRTSIPSNIQKKLRFERFGSNRRNPRDGNTRGWMVRNRARFEAKRRFERQLYALEGLEYDEDEDAEPEEDEDVLFHLEGMIPEEEKQDYSREVQEALEELEEEVEGLRDSHASKNY